MKHKYKKTSLKIINKKVVEIIKMIFIIDSLKQIENIEDFIYINECIINKNRFKKMLLREEEERMNIIIITWRIKL